MSQAVDNITGTAEIHVISGHRAVGQANKRRTDVRPIPTRRAISALLKPFANSRLTSFSFFAAALADARAVALRLLPADPGFDPFPNNLPLEVGKD